TRPAVGQPSPAERRRPATNDARPLAAPGAWRAGAADERVGLCPSMILRNPQFLVFLALIPALALAWRLRRGRVSGAALALRLLGVTLIVVALADPVIAREAPTPGALVLLVDQSDSLGADGKAALRAQADALAAAHRGQVELIAFGANAVAETQ